MRTLFSVNKGEKELLSQASCHSTTKRTNISNYLDFFWNKYYRAYTEWWDNQNIKNYSRFLDSRHKIIKDSLWISDGYKSCWDQEELQRRGLHLLVEVENGELSTRKKVKAFQNNAHEEVKEQNMSVISNNYVKFVEDTCGPFALITLLQACVKQRDLERGSEIHTAIVRRGLLENVFVSSALISMYTKCGALAKAREVFDELPVRSVVSWTALISGYVQHGYDEEALECFEWMQLDGMSPNAVTFVCILKACGSIGASGKGEEIYVQVVTAGLLEKEIAVGTALVDMYAKCGLLGKAQEVFDELPVRNAVLWNALIAGYVQLGHGEKALNCFKLMQRDGFHPEAVTFSCILKACSSLGLANKGQEIHVQIAAAGSLSKDVVVGTALIDMYAKCGLLQRAQAVFDELPVRNVVLWTALIAGYALHGHCEEALNCFEQMMQGGGLSPDLVTFDCILKACGSMGALDKGQKIHAKIVRDGLLQKESVSTSLVDMYAKCGKLEKAQEVFDELSRRNIVSWNVLIVGYTQHGYGENALHYFESMQRDGLSPDAVIFTCILQACGSIRAADKGEEVHAQIVTAGLLEDIVVGSAIVDMYAKCGLLGKAQEVFDELPLHNVVSWTALITGYARHGHNEEALKCFERMQMGGLSPDAITFACILRACGSIGALDKGTEIHAKIVRDGLLEDIVHSALIDMFTKFGLLAKAQEVLEELSVQTLGSWTVLIAAYVQHGQGEKAVTCFEWIQREGLSPDAVTFACILKACGSLGAFDKGQEIHAIIARDDILEQESMVFNALIDMYGKCGLLQKTQEVFDKLLTRDKITWNALIAGHAQLGNSATVLNLFDKMLEEGEVPDLVTFTILLNTCSHRGLLDEGQLFFETMSSGYGVVPNVEHHACMIDLFGRAGHLEKAAALIQEMPVSANHTVWSTMLGACQKWGDLKIGSWAYKHAVQLDEKHTAAYVCMSNIYAAANRQEDSNTF